MDRVAVETTTERSECLMNDARACGGDRRAGLGVRALLAVGRRDEGHRRGRSGVPGQRGRRCRDRRAAVAWQHWVPGFLTLGFGLSTLGAFIISTPSGFFGVHEQWVGLRVGRGRLRGDRDRHGRLAAAGRQPAEVTPPVSGPVDRRVVRTSTEAMSPRSAAVAAVIRIVVRRRRARCPPARRCRRGSPRTARS